MSFIKDDYNSYDNNLYCDVCDRRIKHMEEYMWFDGQEKILCSDSCLEKFIEDFIEDHIMYCENC